MPLRNICLITRPDQRLGGITGMTRQQCVNVATSVIPDARVELNLAPSEVFATCDCQFPYPLIDEVYVEYI